MDSEETRYNNRQIERMFDAQSVDLKDHFDNSINPLTEQVTKTNGRVKELEIERAKQEGYNKALARATTAGFAIMLGLSSWALYEVANIGHNVHLQIESALQEELPGVVQQSVNTVLPQDIQEALAPYSSK